MNEKIHLSILKFSFVIIEKKSFTALARGRPKANVKVCDHDRKYQNGSA
jgi:hypothetical protein